MKISRSCGDIKRFSQIEEGLLDHDDLDYEGDNNYEITTGLIH